MPVPGPKALAATWAHSMDVYARFMKQLDISKLPWRYDIELDATLRETKVQVDMQRNKVRMHPNLFFRYQSAFVDAGIIPVPAHKTIATMLAFMERCIASVAEVAVATMQFDASQEETPSAQTTNSETVH